jgi:hypothetical protein
MAIKTFTTGEVLTAADTNTYLANAGLVAMKPTSVSGTGVTLSGATATITAASTASIIGCFNASFTNYVVVYNFTASSSYIRMKVRTASADVSTGYGGTMAYIADNSTSWNWLNPGAATWNDTRWLISLPERSFGSVSVFNPFLAANTFIDGGGTSISGTNSTKAVNGGRNTGTDVCTGLTLFPDSGTFTGTVTVYGYRL